MITDIEQLKPMGGKYAAQRMYQDGQGQESNPYPADHKQHDVFAFEMTRLQHEELNELMGFNS